MDKPEKPLKVSGPSAPKKRFKKRMRGITRGPLAMAALSRLAIGYLRLVFSTNKFVVEPEDAVDRVIPDQPVIVAVWHGQHILLPVLPIGLNGSAMISRNFDGEVTARIVEHFGNKTIRASGGRDQKDILKKGGMVGFLDMLHTLEKGQNVIQTADVPKGVSRRTGLGIITLAQRSGRPIVPLAIASSRRKVFKKSWDKTTLNLPFGTTAICMGELLNVPADADADAMERFRDSLDARMNATTKRAYELCGRPE